MPSRFVFFLTGLLVLLPVAAAAQSTDVSVVAEAEPMEVGTQEDITVTVRIQGAKLDDITTPEPPATSNLVLKQSTPTTRRDLSFESGRMVRSVTYQWTYSPRRVGIARVRPVEVAIGRQTFQTDEIRIRVVSQQQRRSSPAQGTTPRPTRPRFDSSSDDRPSPKDLFIRTDPSATQAYQNEQITVVYRIFFRPGMELRHSRIADAWDANGFWREDLNVASRPVPQRRVIDGTEYQSIILKRAALFPTRPGALDVEPFRIETEASMTSSSDPYASGRRFAPLTLASDPLTVDVRPLPDGAPRTFQGAVGQFTLSTQLSADSARVGSALRLTATVRGAGNLSTLQAPVVDVPSAFDRYDPSVTSSINRKGRVIRGEKSFAYVLVPRESGRYRIPPVAFSYFNPETERYVTRQSAPMQVDVYGDAAPVATSTTGRGLPVGDVTALMTESPSWMRTDAAPLHRQPWAYAALLIPLLVAGGVWAARRASEPPVDVTPSRRDAALATAQEHLEQAHRHLRESDVKPFYRNIERAVLGFIADRLDTPVPGLTRSALNDALDRYDADRGDREALRELLDACDQAQFTPVAPSHDSMRAALHHAEELILHLDDVLPDA